MDGSRRDHATGYKLGTERQMSCASSCVQNSKAKNETGTLNVKDDWRTWGGAGAVESQCVIPTSVGLSEGPTDIRFL